MPGVIVDADKVPAPEVDAAVTTEPPVDETPPREYTVFRENISLDIDFRQKSIKGRADIFITAKDSNLSEVFIDARQCQVDVDNVTVSSCPAKAAYTDPHACLETPKAYRWSASQWAIRKQRMRPVQHRRRVELSASEHEERFCCTPADGSLQVTIPPLKDIQASIAKLREKDGLRKQQKEPWDKVVEDNNGSMVHKISIPFTLTNIRDGLQFVGVEETDVRYPHVYTRHSVEPGTASSIFPCIDDPGCRSAWKISITFPRTLGDAFHQPLATQQQFNDNGSRKRNHGEDEPRNRVFGLTEEDKLLEMTVVCSGRLEDEAVSQDDQTKKTMTFSCEGKAAHHIGFAVGPFEHVDLWSEFRSEEDDEKLAAIATKIHGYCLPGRADEVSNTCAALVTAIDHFVLTFGRYPFDSYKVCFVDDMVTDTVPLVGFSLCTTRMLFPQRVIDTEVEMTRTLVHALASQWFGVNIIPDRKADIWLVVGIAWFMTDLFMKVLCGNNEYRFRMKAMSDKLIELDVNRPSLQSLGEHLHLGDFEIDFMNLKAPLVLFILDRRLSKSSGSAGITRIISKMVSKANTSGEASDQIFVSEPFRKHCEKYGQTRLESFWAQWVIGSGCPRFDVYQKFNKKKLCVEMTIRQIQDMAAAKTRPLEKSAFWRDVMEENHAVWAGELQHSFSGPMTIRIHEADGTPYEHIVEIKEEGAKSVKFDIPYNTKYKRLKRNRRQRERQQAGNTSKQNEDNQEESLLYCLGDVIQTEEELNDWGFTDWDEKQEAAMDQESYEWIRMDADFEWVCYMQTNLPAYMYVSQLQQDRDVVAQQDSMLYLAQKSKSPHPLVSTILTRTLVDQRYFHGIRTMAAEILPKHAVELLSRIGLKHLLKAYQHFFCVEGTYTPRPNNFSDKRQYLVQCAIPEAVAQVRDKDGKCPKEARRFILQQLQCIDNDENPYSDHLYICKLICALATCQIPDEKKEKPLPMSLTFGDGDEDDEIVDPEPQEFKELALEEIERYRRMDEYSPSFQNCFTVAALDAMCRLMKAKVVPINPILFVQYLQDRTVDVVRIKGFEAMVELGQLSREVFLKFFLSVLSTDPSPYVRDRLFKIFCGGLASIAFGESGRAEKDKPVSNESGLIVEQDSSVIEAKQKEKARREDLTTALAALKEATKNDKALLRTLWKTLDSPVLSVAERRNLLELCSILTDEEDSLVVAFKYPTYWTAQRAEKKGGRLLVTFKRHFRTKSRKTYVAQPISVRPEPKRTITLNLNRSTSSTAARAATPVAATPPPLPPPVVKPAAKPTVTVATPRPIATNRPASPRPAKEIRRDSIAVQTPRPSIEITAPTERKPLPQAVKPSAPDTVAAPVKSSVPTKASAPVKVSAPAKTSAPVKTAPVKTSAPMKSLGLNKASGSSRGPAALKGSAPARIPIKLAGPVKTGTPPPMTNRPGGLATNNGHLAPKTLKRHSTEPSEGPRPTKLVKLNTKGFPPHVFQKRSRKVTVKFTKWDKLKIKAPKQPRAPSEAGSIRATPKGPLVVERSNSIKVSSPAASQSPQLSTPTTANNTSFSPPPSASQISSNSTSYSQTSAAGNGSKPARKPLPSGDRKPLPSGERKSLPSGGRTMLPSGSAHPPPTQHSNTSAAPQKTKIKLKVKPSVQR
ncbi:uncharacterized protein BCR38DRAFT_135948 [Pseudomassariella vexata]|uniref:Transcription initiation factor TFIID subunit 2 n=1 Tax=Pseudomassariella vexata TaxID=1141098 RepID=A0A1Y2EAQ7_9PEZI|nr:uncharacterized protein BCR38DRAFT_135948 [Pseudomassariella vexata]ORY68651.1 hypothetical protein BCR38DRAFT_135948 [Pseudomassariella vexata]